MQERMTLANMTAELGGQTGLIDPTRSPSIHPRAGAEPGDTARWHRRCRSRAASITASTRAAGAAGRGAAQPGQCGAGRRATADAIDVAYIGACTGAKLRPAHGGARARRPQGRAGMRCWWRRPRAATRRRPRATARCSPARGRRQAPAERLRHVRRLRRQARRERHLHLVDRAQLQGPHGHAERAVYLGSPYTVAASAVTGRIADPREMHCRAGRA
jgi:3-isopropylmalate/(R)-2-methylmalate dehydratase large subunit